MEKYNHIALDTPVFIYHFEKNEEYFPLIKEIFTALDKNSISAVTSIVTLIELLVKPIEDERTDLIELYSSKLLGDEALKTSLLTSKIAMKSAELRAKYRFKTPDAIQLATAFTEKAEVFITNDIDLKRVDGLEVIILQDLLG